LRLFLLRDRARRAHVPRRPVHVTVREGRERVERPEERVAYDAEEHRREPRPEAAIAIAAVLVRAREADPDREEDRDVSEEDDRDPRAHDEARDAERAALHRVAEARELVARLPGLGEAGGEAKQEIAFARDAEVSAVLRDERVEPALRVAQRKAAF